MSQFPGVQIIETPELPLFPFGALLQLDVQDGGPHFTQRLAFESVALGEDYALTYSTGTDPFPNADTPESELIYTTMDGFTIYRRVVLGIPSGGALAEQEARALARFSGYESELVETELATSFNTAGTNLGKFTVAEDALGACLDVAAQNFAGKPQVHAAVGPGARLEWRAVAKDLGMDLIIGRGYSNDTTGKVGRIWVTPEVHLRRTDPILAQYPRLATNIADTLVERDYLAYWDGPIFFADTVIATVAA